MKVEFTILGEPASSRVTYIYALLDPDDLVPRYVGKSDAPLFRYRRHLKDCVDTHKGRWIRELARDGKRPVLRILQVVQFVQWQRAEREWIARFGAGLTNSTEGGIGPLAPSDETREKMRQRKLGGRHTLAHRRKVSAALIGKAKPPRTAEHAAALSRACKGRIIQPAQRAKLAIANMKRPVTGKSGYRGVHWDRTRGKYQAYITLDSRIVHLGRFPTAIEAATAFNARASAHGWPAEGLNQL